jgi:glycosyltransferase involved in cell wall biosynthesis
MNTIEQENIHKPENIKASFLKQQPVKVAILFDRFGPYHIARLEAANKYVQVIPIEVFGETTEYQWDKVDNGNLGTRITLFNQKAGPQVSAAELKSALLTELDRLKPEVVAINGWFDKSALAALYWCVTRKVPAVVMSESTATDDKRTWWKEWVKKKIVSQFSAGLVGGKRHAAYLNQLGLPTGTISFGYDVVDNQYFQVESDKVRQQRDLYQQKFGLPDHYFLVVSRFIEKKNLPFIISAYAKYLELAKDTAWDLYILGDGPLKNQLLDQVNALALQKKVHFTGFKQYKDLPAYFGLAKAFVHASTTEQWGLVVNEAMASGLPVIISEECGCVPELVHTGENGFAIDPKNEQALTNILHGFSSGKYEVAEMGAASRRIVAKLNTDAFGKGMLQAITTAKANGKSKPSLASRFLINLLVSR